ncbi:MAG: prepilin-type N-terminal cleavage/methylation domain-containing protein [Myxococcota bacterium]
MNAHRTRPARRGGGRREAGFTLLELMTALVAGLVAVTATYLISAETSRHFNEQARVAQTQTSVRMAMEQLRRDIARAGFFGTPNTQTEQRCVNAAFNYGALAYQDGAGTAALPLAGVNNVEADQLTLVGNYATSDGYLARPAGAANNAVIVQEGWQAFRRSFGAPEIPAGGAGFTANAYDPNFFQAVFSQDNQLHIETTAGNHFFVAIQGSTGVNRQVAFAPGTPPNPDCGDLTGSTVAPLSRIRYRVLDPAADARFAALVNPTDAARGITNSVLIREQIQFNGADTVVPGTERVILEYVANFSLTFVVDNRAPPFAGPPNLVLLDDTQGAQAFLAANPERVRSVIVDLSARTPDADPGFRPLAGNRDPAANGPLTRYRVIPNLDAAARVRSIRSEIFLPNVAP